MIGGMSTIEAETRMVLDSVYTCCLGRVTESQVGRYCKIELISATEKEKSLPLIYVPVARWIGTSSPVVKGMVIPVYFSKWAIGEYLTGEGDHTNKTPLKEIQFSRNDAFALPIVFDDMLEDEFPETIVFHDKTIFESEVEMNSTLKVESSVEMNSTLEVSSDISSETKVSAPVGEFGNVAASSSLTVGGTEMSGHVHSGGTLPNGNTGAPV